jgi:thymidine kinase
MAKLFFRYGAMGSSKTANALMVEYNYRERGKKAVLCKPKTDSRDGELIIKSRIGLERPCVLVESLCEMTDAQIQEYDCVIVDEAQFCNKEQIEFFVHIVDDLNVPVICYGLRADFRNELFPGSLWLLAWADVIEEIKTVCWCGKAARCNGRFNEYGVIREGDQVFLGGNSSYIALCRKHHREGNLGPYFREWQEE